MINGTWWTLEAHMVIRAAAAVDLLFIDAPEALVQTGMHHLPGVCGCDPVAGACLHGHRPGTHPLSIVKTDGLQALIVSVAPWMVDVEPGCPLRHPCVAQEWRETGVRPGVRFMCSLREKSVTTILQRSWDAHGNAIDKTFFQAFLD